MSDEEDPEVVADRRLRDSSMRDRSRSRTTEAAIGHWTPEKPVGMWRCRGFASQPCPQHSMVPITEETMQLWMQFNAMLRKRGDEPISTDEVVRCDACRRGIAAMRPAKLRERVEQLAQAIRDLKACNEPRKERELIKQIEAWGHPDVPGLLQALDDKARSTKGQRVSKASL